MNKKLLIFILLGALVGLYLYMKNLSAELDRNIVWGLTFSSKFSRQLNNDWQKNFKTILNELKPNNIRLVAYWDEIEKNKDIFDFSDLDWQMNEVKDRNINVILVIGMKVPRWPECHLPDFVKELSIEKREEALGKYLRKIIERYKNRSILYAWQVENEPFLSFGENCPLFGGDFLDEELALVRKLDKNHPIMVTDSGELSLWFRAQKRGDIFGSTMYITVWTQSLGYYKYPFPPSFFRIKRAFSEIYGGTPHSIVAELQAEPWGPDENYRPDNYPVADQWKTFNDETLREHVEYATRTGFDEFYLWGVEWWYWIKLQGHPEVWEEAKKLF